MKPNEFELVSYDQSMKALWDDFVKTSKNGTFLFQRDYMEYHSDRFKDNSLLFFSKGSPYCILPATRDSKIFKSHGGLTYGGLVMGERCTTEGILRVFDLLIGYLRKSGFREMVYKPVPHIYHRLPSEEDLYALFRNNAVISGRNIASVVRQDNPIKWSQLRTRCLKKSKVSHVKVSHSSDYQSFWRILCENLNERYDAAPVHSLEEMSLLAGMFPGNIKLYTASLDNEMVGGVVVYVTDLVAHTQYISANQKGKDCGAIDAVFNFLLNDEFKNKPYFDFGTSNEDGGKFLNESLIFQKQGFGGRGVCYDTYCLEITP